MRYISNAFSPKMITDDCLLSVEILDANTFFNEIRDCYSIVGHQKIASYLGVTYNRQSITLSEDDVLYIASEGLERLPEGDFCFVPEIVQYYKIEVLPKYDAEEPQTHEAAEPQTGDGDELP